MCVSFSQRVPRFTEKSRGLWGFSRSVINFQLLLIATEISSCVQHVSCEGMVCMMDLFQPAFPVADMASAFWQSTLPGKVIVFLLFLGSASAWTIMVTKGMQLRAAGRSTEQFLNAFRAERDPTVLFTRREEMSGTPLQAIYREGCKGVGGGVAGTWRRSR